jgi:hypothetical protein
MLRPKVLDISEGGATRPSSWTRPMRAFFSLRAPRINIVGSATVRHALRCARTTIGAKLSRSLLSASERERLGLSFRNPPTP